MSATSTLSRSLLTAVWFTVSLVLAWYGAAATAQEYPSRALRLVTMYAPGSASDNTARATAAAFTKQLNGLAVIVENKGGAGGLLGTMDVLRAQPVGYSILLASPLLVSNIHGYKNPQYKLEDFAAIGPLGVTSYGMIVNVKEVPVTNLKEFIAYAKANPGKLNYASLGQTSGQGMLAERFKDVAGIDMVGVPFKGGDPAAQALLSGQVQVYFPTLNTARNRMQNPQIRGMAVVHVQRSRLLPDLPTFTELGFPTMVALQWDGLFVPATTPRAMQQKLQSVLKGALASPEFKAYLEKVEREPWAGTLEEYVAFIRKEGEQLASELRRLNIPLQD